MTVDSRVGESSSSVCRGVEVGSRELVRLWTLESGRSASVRRGVGVGS